MKVQTLIAAGLVLAGFSAVNPVRGDAVVDWNIITIQAVGAGARAGGAGGPGYSSRPGLRTFLRPRTGALRSTRLLCRLLPHEGVRRVVKDCLLEVELKT